MGSFANVLIYRLPRNEKVSGRSKCPHCKNVLRAGELVPVLSFIFLKGKCAHCGGKISILYPLVEIASGILFVFALFHASGGILIAAVLAAALWTLLAIAVTDSLTKTIPDILNIPFVLMAIIYAWLTGFLPIIAPLAAGGFFALQWIISRGRWVGSGDIILAAGIGFLLGEWQMVVIAIAAAYIAGGVFAAGVLISGKKGRGSQMPFGPFLAIAAVIVLAWGEKLLGMLYRY
ncbi:MAG: Type 4 prepilin-like protein leader peptide-processing enzyme [Candidatus Saccharibacteria bacterium GW2011_GWA2_46_10]|nr:MAG: Type 4 prepilin-like protein leader peptide-processing enzyme [Candidatus Saccharibacteria bacterium GW2011_GWA2_46_10]